MRKKVVRGFKGYPYEEEEEEKEGEEEIQGPYRILVTGSCNLKGIGHALAKMLLERNHKVIITGRTEKECIPGYRKLLSFDEKNKGNLSVQFLDLTCSEKPENEVDLTRENHYFFLRELKKVLKKEGGKIDILVNNASCCEYGKEDSQINFETNFFGTRDFTDMLLEEGLISENGKIVNITCAISRLSRTPMIDTETKMKFLKWKDYKEIKKQIDVYYNLEEEGDWCTYHKWGGEEEYTAFSISKMCLNGYTQYLSKRVSQTVFCCCPGWCRTEKGGKDAKRSPEDGAKTIFDLIMKNDKRMNGNFFDPFGCVEY